MGICLVHLVQILNVYCLLCQICCILSCWHVHTVIRLKIWKPVILGCWRGAENILYAIGIALGWRCVEVQEVHCCCISLRLIWLLLRRHSSRPCTRWWRGKSSHRPLGRLLRKICGLFNWRCHFLVTRVIIAMFVVFRFFWLVVKTISAKIFLVVYQVFLELFGLIFIQPCGIVIPIFIICPFFVDVFIGHKFRHHLVGGVGVWLTVSFGEVLLPVRVHDLVRETLEKFHFACGPFVQIHWFHFCNMYTKLSMNT